MVDSGDELLDAELSGYRPVIVGYRRTVQFPVGLPAAQAADGRSEPRQGADPATGHG